MNKLRVRQGMCPDSKRGAYCRPQGALPALRRWTTLQEYSRQKAGNARRESGSITHDLHPVLYDDVEIQVRFSDDDGLRTDATHACQHCALWGTYR